MRDGDGRGRFETLVLAHLDAGYNLARWLLRDEAAAEDAVQEASLRAFRAFDRMHGDNPRAWFMAVVRNACLDLLKERRRRVADECYDDELHGGTAHAGGAESPEAAALRASDARDLRACIEGLPLEYREVLVLRELEELSYKEISAIVGVPMGTVMSRLSRGRDLLQRRMLDPARRSAP